MDGHPTDGTVDVIARAVEEFDMFRSQEWIPSSKISSRSVPMVGKWWKKNLLGIPLRNR